MLLEWKAYISAENVGLVLFASIFIFSKLCGWVHVPTHCLLGKGLGNHEDRA